MDQECHNFQEFKWNKYDVQPNHVNRFMILNL